MRLALIFSVFIVAQAGVGVARPGTVPQSGRQRPAQDAVLAQTREEIMGALDFSKAIEDQIEFLEASLKTAGDMAAERQSLILLWLADLYDSIGDYDGVERSYQRILVFFPDDIGVMNSYARFLLEKRQDTAHAESLLVGAFRWASFKDSRALDRGDTNELLARVRILGGDAKSAIWHATAAIELKEDEASAAATRVLAQAYTLEGDFDAAARTYVELIALERGAVTEDINALKLVVARTDTYDASEINEVIDRAIAQRNAERKRQAEAEGAELVEIVSDDGVPLEGTLRRRGGNGAVLFVPDLGGTRTIYRPYAQLLGIDGVSSLTLDLRGQGGSRSDSLLSQETLPLAHAQRLPDDVAAGFRYLQGELGPNPRRIVIVTTGYAAPVVEEALSGAGLAAPVAYLSPAFSPLDVDLTNSIAFHPDLPILLYYSEEDLHASRSCAYFRKTKHFSKLQVKSFKDSGRGVDILRRNTAALENFQEWVRKVTSPP
jgi:tetratricopeptide (TPR) repeat protein